MNKQKIIVQILKFIFIAMLLVFAIYIVNLNK